MSKLIKFIFLSAFMPLLIWAIGWMFFATNIALMKPAKSHSEKTQAIVVLTGDDGRVNEGLNLLADNTAPQLFISGVNKDTTKKDIFNNWQTDLKSKPCCLTLGYESTDTITNATEVKAWVTDNNIDSFHLVTSSYHMPRAMLEMRKELPHTTIIKYPVISNEFKAWKGRFWRLTFSEYNKTLIRWMQNLGAA